MPRQSCHFYYDLFVKFEPVQSQQSWVQCVVGVSVLYTDILLRGDAVFARFLQLFFFTDLCIAVRSGRTHQTYQGPLAYLLFIIGAGQVLVVVRCTLHQYALQSQSCNNTFLIISFHLASVLCFVPAQPTISELVRRSEEPPLY